MGNGANPTAAFADRLAYQGIKTAAGIATNTAIGGADLGDSLKSGGLSLVTTMATQTLAQGIGDLAHDLAIEDGDIRKVLAHAVAGCAAGAASRQCLAGAIGAGLQELAGDSINQLTASPERQVQLSGLIAATAALLAGGDADAVNAANAIAQDARTYNRQLHVQEVQKLRELAPEYAKEQHISEDEALRRLLAETLRRVDQDYYEAHSEWDQTAGAFLNRNASGLITVAGQEVLMFTAGGGGAFKTDPTLLADTWASYQDEFQKAYLQTGGQTAAEKFADQQKILDAYLTAVGMLPYGGSAIATLVQYDQAARADDTQTMNEIIASLPLELVPMASSLGKLAQTRWAVDVAADSLKAKQQISNVRRIGVDEANAPFIADGWNPPYSGTSVRTFTTESEIAFVRVSTPEFPTGRFLVRADEIAGMSPQQIQQYLALPRVPTHISEVTVPAGTPMQMGRIAPQPSYAGAPGGGIQYQLRSNIDDGNFGTQRPIQ